MLFKKCQKPYRTTKDIAKPSSYDTASDKDLWTPADSSQSTFRYTYDSPKGSQLTSSFTSSSKIVNLLSLSLSILHKIFSHQHHRIKYHNNIHQLIFLFCFFLLSSFFSPLPSTNSSRHEATSTWARGRRSGGRRSPTSRASRTRRWKRWRGSTSSAH